MKYIKKFNEQKVTIFDNQWTQVIPGTLSLSSSNGQFTLNLNQDRSNLGHQKNVTNVMNWVNICYNQNTAEDGDVLKDGEPDYLCFDICFLKDNDGYQDDSELKLSVDITYGDSMMYEFNLKMPNKVELFHYDGYGSKYDPDYYWGFEDESVKKIVDFFNRFGFSYTPKDFTFLDKHLDSYIHKI